MYGKGNLKMSTPRARTGARGEKFAGEYLTSRGYEIVETNFRCPWGEVDIVALDGNCLVFIEVRTRRRDSSYGAPEESLSKRKREKLVAAAETYVQSHPTQPTDWRIDLVAIHLDARAQCKKWPT